MPQWFSYIIIGTRRRFEAKAIKRGTIGMGGNRNTTQERKRTCLRPAGNGQVQRMHFRSLNLICVMEKWLVRSVEAQVGKGL
jgi:hypothetical protein